MNYVHHSTLPFPFQIFFLQRLLFAFRVFTVCLPLGPWRRRHSERAARQLLIFLRSLIMSHEKVINIFTSWFASFCVVVCQLLACGLKNVCYVRRASRRNSGSRPTKSDTVLSTPTCRHSRGRSQDVSQMVSCGDSAAQANIIIKGMD